MNTIDMDTENFCDDCDDVLHAVFNIKDFWGHKVGLIRCKCGCVVKPCNECGGEDADGNAVSCDNCPWVNAKITDAMTDEEYVLWLKDNDKNTFEVYADPKNGYDHYREVIETLEVQGKLK